MKSNEQGRSMIEMLGVLAIVGVLSVGGIAGYSKAMAKFKTNKIIDEVTMLSTNIRTLFGSQGNYQGLDNQLAIDTGVVPNGMYTQGATGNNADKIVNSFSGDVLIKTSGSTNAYKYFYIGADKIPENACVTIATTDWGADASSGLQGMYVDNGGTELSTVITSAATSNNDTLDSESASPSPSSVSPMGINTMAEGDDEEEPVATGSGTWAGPSALPFKIISATTACKPSDGNTTAIVWVFS